MKKLIALVCACMLGVVTAAAAATPHKAPAAHARTSTAVSGLDRQFLATSIQTDLAEIQGGRAALGKSTDPAVDKLAKTIVTDHSAMLASADTLARSLGIAAPTTPSPEQVWDMSIVSTFSGKAFNHWFAKLNVAGHVQAIQQTTFEVAYGTNSRIRAAARSALPMLRTHLRLAEAAVKANP